MKGRNLGIHLYDRIPDHKPGDYWQIGDGDDPKSPITVEGVPSNLTKTLWRVVTPLGQIGTLHFHTVRENDDGTISVLPGDGSSNSILITDHRGSWHGYIYNGEWREV